MFPPSLAKDNLLQSHTYIHAPEISGPLMLGVDEAGRGPVLGPMVYACAFCAIDYKPELAKAGFADSKVLTAGKREQLLRGLGAQPLCNKIGWATTVMTAADISAGMLRKSAAYNLNEQAHDTTISLIGMVLARGYDVRQVYVDTVGPAKKYQDKLSARFPGVEFVVAQKADSLYAIVSCASICAKVTRDASLNSQLTGAGSGYPSDPESVLWLKANMDPVFGWGPLVRYSWQTVKAMLGPEEWVGEADTGSAGLSNLGVDFYAR